MPLLGIPPALAARIGALLESSRTREHRGPLGKNLSHGQIVHFRQASGSLAEVPPDQTHLHVLQMARQITLERDETQPLGIEMGEVLRQWETLLAPLGNVGNRFFRSALVPPGQRTLSSQIEWSPGMERRHWWALSDERFTPYHFYTDRPQETVITLGGHQGFNLVNGQTDRLLLLDWDARQLLNHTFLLALLLVSGDPPQFIQNALALYTESRRSLMVEKMMRALREGEERGIIEKGRHRFFAEASLRTGTLSIMALLANYQDLFLRLSRGEPLTSRQRPNVEWLLRPGRYQNLLKMVWEGRVANLQANIFDPSASRAIIDRLDRWGRRVSTLYLSNAFDIYDQLVDRRHCFVQLASLVGEIPFSEGGRLLWTYLSHENREYEREDGRFVERVGPPAILSDPYDKYAYFDMAIGTVREWLAPIRIEDWASRERDHELEAIVYYWRLGNLIWERGRWVEGKWVVSERPTGGGGIWDRGKIWVPREGGISPREAFERRYRI